MEGFHRPSDVERNPRRSPFKVNRKQGETLIDVIMEFSRDPSPLVLLRVDEPASQSANSLFSIFTVIDVDARPDEPGKGTVRVEPGCTRISHPAILSVETTQSVFCSETLA